MSRRWKLAALCVIAAVLLSACGKDKGFTYGFVAKKAYQYHLVSDETLTYDFGQGDVRKLTTHVEKEYRMMVEKIQDGLVSLRVDVTKINQTSQGTTGKVNKTLPDVSLRYTLKAKTGAVTKVELLATPDQSPEPVETLASRYSPANYLPVLPSGTVLQPGEQWTWDSPGVALGSQPKGDLQQHASGVLKTLEGAGDQAVAVFEVETTQGTGATYSVWHLTTRVERATSLPVAADNSATLRYSGLVPLGSKAVQAQVVDQWQESMTRVK